MGLSPSSVLCTARRARKTGPASRPAFARYSVSASAAAKWMPMVRCLLPFSLMVRVACSYAALLDDGRYRCSIATMYRLLRAVGESRERRAQRQHPRYTIPRLVAAAPNQVWSWDITQLGGPAKWLYFSLYVVLDIFSRYVIGWLVAERESHELAGRLITQSMAKQGVTPGTLTVHSDRGARR